MMRRKDYAAALREAADETQRNVVQAMGWCLFVALHQEFGVGAARLERMSAVIDRFEVDYSERVYRSGKPGSLKKLADEVRPFCDPEMRVPVTRGARTRFEQQMQIAANEAASISWQLVALGCHEQLGFGRDRLERLKKAGFENYKQYNSWYLEGGRTRRADGSNYFDGEAGQIYAMTKLKAAVEDALKVPMQLAEDPDEDDPALLRSSGRDTAYRAVDTYTAMQLARRSGLVKEAKGGAVLSSAEIERIAQAAKAADNVRRFTNGKG